MSRGELPAGSESQIVKDTARREDWDAVEELRREIENLKRELTGFRERYRQLHEQYTKLSDMWNAFQSLHRLEPRDVIRAEEAGELARKLATVLIKLAYQVDDPMGLLR